MAGFTTATPRVSTSSHPRDGNFSTSTAHTKDDGAMQAEAFRFVKWVRLHGFDILTMIAMGGIILGVDQAAPVANRTFPVYNLDGAIAYPEYALGQQKQAVPTWASAVISILGPLFFFALFQIRRRSWDDLLTTTLGLLRSIVTSSLLTGIIKCLIGGLRPHFYDVCQPQIPSTTDQLGTGFGNIMYDKSICTTTDHDLLDEALRSMPSGHTATAWAGLLYLSLYFNAQLKVMGGHNPAYWKMVMFFLPLLAAALISLAAQRDHHHHWADILVGTFIGCFTAWIAFRQTFAATFDYRFNHLLLPRATSLFHRRPYLPIVGRGAYYTYQPTNAVIPQDLPVTREGGWGYGVGEHTSGAPGDATALAMGTTNVQPIGGTGHTQHRGPAYHGSDIV